MTVDRKIAIIGVAGTFPGADNISEFWLNLVNGVESISQFKKQQDINVTKGESYIASKGYIANADNFAAEFFNIAPKLAEMIDPQYRLFLEWVWEAFENAGYIPEQLVEKVGVYATSSTQDSYYEKNLKRNKKFSDNAHDYELLIHNAKDFLATLVAYKFNFQGPCINIQTACSSALVAICQACDDLIQRKCQLAVVGGVSLTFPLKKGYIYKSGMIYSKDGHCKPFAKDASGVVPGNGGGVVILKPLQQAINDHDHIYAVIRGYAVNNDGANKLSFAAPGIDGQVNVLKAAAHNALVDPGEIQYIETHGTGTAIGDQIEITALREYICSGKIKPTCLIGAVKSNIGHLDVAAGIASFIKVLMSLKNKTLPKSLHAEITNPSLRLGKELKVVNETIVWPEPKNSKQVYLAGVSSFGIGGTNAHIILENAPINEIPNFIENKNNEILILSANSNQELEKHKDNLAVYLSKKPLKIADVAYTLQFGRKVFKKRLATIVSSSSEASRNLLQLGDKHKFRGECRFANAKVVYVFANEYKPIHRTQIFNNLMNFPKFQKEYQQCMHEIYTLTGRNLLKLTTLETSDLMLISVAYQYSLAKTYVELGIKPKKIISYGLGDYIAACFVNLFTFSQTIKLLLKQIELTDRSTNNQVYLHVLLSEQLDLNKPINGAIKIVSIENINRLILFGTYDDIQAFIQHYKESFIYYEIIKNSELLPKKLSNEKQVMWNELVNSLFVKNKTLTNSMLEEKCDIMFWLDKPNACFKFFEDVQSCYDEASIFIDYGITDQNITLIKQINNFNNVNYDCLLVQAVSRTNDELNMYSALATLWVNGLDIHWKQLHADNLKHRIPLPTYPFIKKRYVVEPDMETYLIKKTQQLQSTALNYNKTKIESWLYTKTWKEQSLNATEAFTFDTVIVLADNSKLIKSVVTQLSVKNKYLKIIHVPLTVDNSHSLNQCWFSERCHIWDDVFSKLKNNTKVLILNSMLLTTEAVTITKALRAFYESIALAKASSQKIDIRIKLLTIVDENVVEAALLQGPTMSLSLEYPLIQTKYILLQDIEDKSKYVHGILNETYSSDPSPIIKLGINKRFIKSYTHHLLNDNKTIQSIKIKEKGIYLITGGLGGIGLELANFLSTNYNVGIVLISRTELPEKKDWRSFVTSFELEFPLRTKFKKLINIETKALWLKTFACDISDFGKMEEIIKQLPKIDGVIHAASTVSEGLLNNKSFASMQAMFKAKVIGLDVLLKLFSSRQLDFMILCSALNVERGEIGAIDYISSNAYLNAVAEENNKSNTGFPILSIAWDTWIETGMYASYKAKFSEQSIDINNYESIVKVYPSNYWHTFVEEHEVYNKNIVPGALLISLQVQSLYGDTTTIIKRPMFISSFTFQRQGTIRNIAGAILFISNSKENNKEYNVELHTHLQQKSLAVCLIETIEARDIVNTSIDCYIKSLFEEKPIYDCNYQFDSPIVLGPHWDCLTWIKRRNNEYLAKLTLPDSYLNELEKFILHPSLLDVAISYHARFFKEQYIPYFIGECFVYDKLPQQFYSYIKLENVKPDANTCAASVLIFDLNGKVLLTIKNFILIKFAKNKLEKLMPNKDINKNAEKETLGLTNIEGIQLFQAILDHPKPTTIIVSKQANFNTPKEVYFNDHKPQKPLSNSISKEKVTLIDKVRIILAEVLGLDKIEDKSDFFVLGGDSLFAIQTSYKIKVALNVDISPDVLLENSVLCDFTKKISEFYEVDK